MIAGRETKKLGTRLVSSTQIEPGVWLEIYDNGARVVVADMTSALWQHGRQKPPAVGYGVRCSCSACTRSGDRNT